MLHIYTIQPEYARRRSHPSNINTIHSPLVRNDPKSSSLIISPTTSPSLKSARTMKGLFTTLCLALAHFCQLTEAKSSSWSGTNNYFLQGMSDSAQDAYIQTLSSYNAKVVRLWVNQASKGCQKGSQIVRDIPQLETTIGQYNKVTLDEIDKLLVKLSDKNIKAIISPHDANSLIGDYRKYVVSIHMAQTFNL